MLGRAGRVSARLLSPKVVPHPASSLRLSHSSRFACACPPLRQPIFVGRNRPSAQPLHTTAQAALMASLTAQGRAYLDNHPDERPQFPYEVGTVLTARASRPPPFRGWPEEQRDAAWRDVKEFHPVKAALMRPLPPGTPGDATYRLRIVEAIRVSEQKENGWDAGHRSQVLKVEPVGPVTETSPLWRASRTTGLVAKLYDPVFWCTGEDYLNPLEGCEEDSTNEAYAYEQLEPLWGKVVPYYYGSFEVDVPVPDAGDWGVQTRPVRAVLYEYVPGIRLADVVWGKDKTRFDQSQRQEIMAAFLDADSRVWQMDVNWADVVPRNAIVVSAEKGAKADVRLIDFGEATTGARARQRGYVPTTELEPRSVIAERWDDEGPLEHAMFYFAGIADDWEPKWNEWLKNDYVARDHPAR